MVNTTNTLSRKITLGMLFLAVAGCSLLIYFMPLKEVLNHNHPIKSWLAEIGYAAPAVFTLVAALLTSVGMPRLLLCSLAGIVFGFGWGFVYSHLRGWQSVLLMRQLPISGLYNDILLGLSTVSHGDFWIGTALGFLPLGVTATLIGAGSIQADISQLGLYFGIAACAFFFLTLALKWTLAQLQRKNASTG